jgi:restriction endonuclease S subunit
MGPFVLVDTADHITEDGVMHSATSVMPANSIFLVARSGVLAHSVPIALARRPMAFNQDIKAITVDPTRLEADYAVWFLRSQEGRIPVQGVKRGATVHSLHSGFVENLLVPLPPLEEQRRIVDILNREHTASVGFGAVPLTRLTS